MGIVRTSGVGIAGAEDRNMIVQINHEGNKGQQENRWKGEGTTPKSNNLSKKYSAFTGRKCRERERTLSAAHRPLIKTKDFLQRIQYWVVLKEREKATSLDRKTIQSQQGPTSGWDQEVFNISW